MDKYNIYIIAIEKTKICVNSLTLILNISLCGQIEVEFYVTSKSSFVNLLVYAAAFVIPIGNFNCSSAKMKTSFQSFASR
jgi:hypothetical protein